MLNNNERNLLNFLKYAPIVFIILLSIIISSSLIIENNKKLEKDIILLENNYIESQKNTIKKEVERIYNYILYEKANSEMNLKTQLRERTYEAHAIAHNIYKENKHKSKKEILKLIKDALRDIRFFNGRGYYFIHNIKGFNLLYPLDKSLENKDYSQLEDINSYKFVQTIMKTIQNKTETFDSYYWNIPADDPQDTTNRIYKKIAFYKYFEPLDITISTGEYVQDYEKYLQKRILHYISNMTYGDDGYVFVIDKKERVLAHRDKSLINNFLPMFIDKKNFTQEILESFKEGESFLNYETTYHNDEDKSIEKTTYIKHFASWNWILASGFDNEKLKSLIKKKKEEIDKHHKNYIIKLIFVIFLTTLALLAISIYISRQVQNRFIKYRNKIYKEMKKNRKKDSILAQQSKMAAMGEMIGNIAHQWRQPLSLISTASTGLKLKNELGMLNSKEILETSETITKTTQHLSKTIEDFRNFFRPNKQKEDTTTTLIWQTTSNLIMEQYRTKDISVIIDIEEVKVNILANELIQVILNILNNAKDELVKLNKDDLFIFISMKKENERLVIKIKDNAGGIPPNIFDRIFEPYFTTKHKAQGTGIGLFMSKEIIEKHMHGFLTVQNDAYSYKNKKYIGAIFTINIPLN